MDTFVNYVELLIDNWPTETINVDDLTDKINESIIAPDHKPFVAAYGGCCLGYAIDNYFQRSQDYKLQTGPSFKVLDKLPKSGVARAS